MANEQNLIPNKNRTAEELREITRKGGIKSGQVRKEKATFKKAVQWLIDSDIKIKKGSIAEVFKQSGIDITNLSPTQLATLGLWYGAVQGNSANYRTLMEANQEMQEQSGNAQQPILNINIQTNEKLKETFFEKGDIE
jgi:hypothetical protein